MDRALLTVESTRIALQEKQFSARALVQAFLQAIEKDETHAWLAHPPERALARAAELDRLADKGDPLPPLAGLCLGVKDVISTRGLRTTAGSRMLEHYFPPFDATAVARLEQAGAIVLGKTNCDEFAMGSSNENSAYGVVRNPHDRTRVPGGSSGGSAAAVAGGTAVAALGSDTGGSIRQPAAFCGVVGFMPSYGRVSRYGLLAFASSLDRIGPITRSVKDAALLLQHMAGHDPLDSTSAALPVPDYAAELGKPVRGMKVGVPGEYFGPGLDAEVRAAVEAAIAQLRGLGCEIVPIALPHLEYAIPCYYVLATAEASSNLARYDGVRYGYRARQADTLAEMYQRTRAQGFGPEVKRRILLGTYVLSAGYYEAYYLKAQRVRTLLTRDFEQAFAQVEVVATPTTPTPAFALGGHDTDPVAMYLADIYTVTANLAGIPAVSLPCGKTRAGLPVGLQLLARRFDEPALFRLGHAYEHARGPL